jgi:pyruvate carboxylase subunit B
MAKVKITDLTLRDAHQSLLATRMRMRHMEPIVEAMDQVGFYSLEVWGGATFDSCIRYLNEDPWERIRTFKKLMKETPTQMLLRGQNLVGYKHYSDDIAEKFVVKAHENGVDIFRIFDALNDIRNMEFTIKVAKRVGAHVQGAISYTTSPVHTIESFVEMGKQLEALECDSLCIKDMAGLISPKDAYDLVKALKKELSIPILLHSHTTSGMAPISQYAACEAGVDMLDTVFSPLSGGTSHPPTETMIAALKGTPYDTGIDLEALQEITEYFKKIREKYLGILDPISERIDTNVLVYQIPGGMLSNLVSQLKEQNALDKYEEVLKETPRVRADLGYPPLVTPSSQIVGIQAVMNVLLGERYKAVTQEVKDYVKGLYGKSPGPISDDIRVKIIGDEEPITCRPADLIEPQWHTMKEEAEKLGIAKSEEDILTYALFPAIAPKFLKGELKEEELKPPQEETVPERAIPTDFRVEVDGEEFSVKVEPVGGYIEIGEAAAGSAAAPTGPVEGGVPSPMQGMIVKLKVKEGDEVKEGDVIAVLEAMKMQNDVTSPVEGTVEKVLVSEGDSVSAGDPIMVIK